MYQDTLKSGFNDLKDRDGSIYTASGQQIKLTNYNSGVQGAIAPGELTKTSETELPAIMARENGANRITIQGLGQIDSSLSGTDITDKYFDVMFYGRSSDSGLVPLLEVRFTLGEAVNGRVEDGKKWCVANKITISNKYCDRTIEINGCSGSSVIAKATAELSFDLQGSQQIFPEYKISGGNCEDAKLRVKFW